MHHDLCAGAGELAPEGVAGASQMVCGRDDDDAMGARWEQAPQQGGWLTTTYGKGRWTYMAYALHRQVPYGVAGAYRILANLITP